MVIGVMDIDELDKDLFSSGVEINTLMDMVTDIEHRESEKSVNKRLKDYLQDYADESED